MTIETKYNIGDEVWVTNCENVPIKCCVHRIRIDIANGVENVRYDIQHKDWRFPITMPSYALFPTKEELLKSCKTFQ